MEVETEEQPPKNKVRHRKKHLYNSISQQMEFYFSDSNLSKDRFLSNLIKEDPYISLEVFLKFNKIRKLTTNIEDIKKAIKNSEIIELSADGEKIGRKVPVKEKTNVDECTIYVEQLKADASHDWLTSVFSEFGKVVYVSLPRYKHNNSIKGFGFVEFDKETEAQGALAFFESIECKIPSNLEPEQLSSIATFEKESEESENNLKRKREDEEESSSTTEEVKPEETAETNLKRKREDEEESNSTTEQQTEEVKSDETAQNQLKRKHENEEKIQETKTDETPENHLKRKHEDGEESESKKAKTDADVTKKEESSGKKKKLKKEAKRRNYMKELGIRVLSKKEWKKMRNKYLDMQRQKMKEFKKHLYKAKYGSANYEEKECETKIDEEKVPQSNLEFAEGLIVKITLPDASIDMKKLKSDVKACNDVKYVDICNPGSKIIYVRFGSSESASTFCSSDSFGAKELLKDDEEKFYWDKLLSYKEKKEGKEVRKKKRGRDKLLQKANKLMGHHIKFDD